MMSQETKACSKLTTKKALVVFQLMLSGAFIISLGQNFEICDGVFLVKLHSFTKNGSERVYDGLCDVVCIKLWAVRKSVFRKAVSLY